ncbi:MAG: N-acetyltransferase [Gemmatimonadetes bacterium]|nr:N-acetyltransferase [Gemmatimonadota bacterium]MBI2401552.1 N-acetyltransferase [Gemmatimonadota bacterium]MBI2535778.1 N-acetyltransferase [Gemmatimonadota bacterium]MBI2615922.1 N-acetyltransferase [Gemmatimonadota bacterium]
MQHDSALRKFSAIVEGEEAYLRYYPAGEGVLEYASTFVPERLRGRGIASVVVRQALEYAREGGYQVIPSCWFVRGYIQRHAEYAPLVAN